MDLPFLQLHSQQELRYFDPVSPTFKYRLCRVIICILLLVFQDVLSSQECSADREF